MTLPYDYARCAGTTHQTCQLCRRREPGRAQWQSYIAPPIDVLTGICGSVIAMLPMRLSSSTPPDASQPDPQSMGPKREFLPLGDEFPEPHMDGSVRDTRGQTAQQE